MKKWVVILGLLIFMGVTNPTKAEFVSWVEQRAIEQSDGLIEKGLLYLTAETWADSLTKTNDYIIFSTYTMLMPDGNEITYVGGFSSFLPIGNVTIHVNGGLDGILTFSCFIVIALISIRVIRKLSKVKESEEDQEEEVKNSV